MSLLKRLSREQWWVISKLRDVPFVFELTDSKTTTRRSISEYEQAILESLQSDDEYTDEHISILRSGNEVFFRSGDDRVSTYRKSSGIRRLFFDIETSPLLAWTFRTGYNLSISWKNIYKESKIICISYKWEGEDEVHNLAWEDNDDTALLRRFVEVANTADELIGHNGDRFDLPRIRTRCIKNGIPMFPKYRTLDTLKKSRSNFSFDSNALDHLVQTLGLGAKKEHEGLPLWIKCVEGDDEALKYMCEYCDEDVVILERLYHAIQHYIKPNTHVGVHLGKGRWTCPSCGSEAISYIKDDVTEKGILSRVVRCEDCTHVYNISNKVYMDYLTFRMQNLR